MMFILANIQGRIAAALFVKQHTYNNPQRFLLRSDAC
jgi:hypothetical protein